MKNQKEKIDELIKETLSQEEAEFYDELGEQNLLEKIGETFQGKTGWLAILMNIMTLVFFSLFIYCCVQFIDSDQTNDLIKWSVAGFLCWSIIAFLKLYVWMQMDKNEILRELKRLELQVSVMSNMLAK